MPNTPTTIWLDIETTGLDPDKDTIRCIAWAVDDGPIHCVRADDPEGVERFQDDYKYCNRVGGHNPGFDIKFLYKHGIISTVPSNIIDTKLVYHAANPHRSLKLKDLAVQELGIEVVRLEDLQKQGKGSKKRKIKLEDIPIEDLMDYCKQDVSLSRELYAKTEQKNPV